MIETSKQLKDKVRNISKSDNNIAQVMIVSKIDRMATTSGTGAPVVGVEIHIEQPDDNLYLGLEVKAVIQIEAYEDMLMIPMTAINISSSGQFCYVLENGIIQKKDVTTGVSSDKTIEVDGLNEGDIVITKVTNKIVVGIPAEPKMTKTEK